MTDCQKKKETSKVKKFLKWAGFAVFAGGAGYVIGNEKARTAVAQGAGKLCAGVVNIFKKKSDGVDTNPGEQEQPSFNPEPEYKPRREYFGHHNNGYNKPHYNNNK